MSSTEPVQYAVTANYIDGHHDLQLRLFIRALLANSHAENADKLTILRDEADRLERMEVSS